ncbi:MAG: histidinol-phosphate transaminase [Alphaproteobacteria bacterium]|nr:histidinol-phosphate transaminase [Alphaproteobacteria bacterium]
MDWLYDIMRPDLRDLAAYSSARGEAGGFVPTIGIDANEMPWPPFGQIAGLLNAAGRAPNRYPEAQPAALRARLGALWNVPAENILLGRGSDEGIDILMRLLCRAGIDRVMICPPTYGMYKVAAAVQGAAVDAVPLNGDAQLDMPAVLAACRPETKLIFIPSPNAPMGHMMRRDDIIALCRARMGQGVVVVDEAYIEFSDNADGMLPDLAAQPNLVVLRTLSKAHALAGERVGCVIAAAPLIDMLGRIIAPYPLPHSSVQVALDALNPNGVVQNAERRKLIVAERARMTALLPQSPWIKRVFPSAANFILVETTDADAFMKHCRTYGILPRNRDTDMRGAVRLSVGAPAENDTVLRALGVAVPEPEKAALRMPRLFGMHRRTNETEIDVTVDLDAPGFMDIDTGIGFFDHMLAQLASHGGFGLVFRCKGDLHVDQHHSIEDCALTLGMALKNALGDKRGITRFGFTAPLDEALAQAVIDLSGRPYCLFEGALPSPMLGDMGADMVPHFFYSLAMAMAATIHITVRGDNAHHMVEASFKATGRALRQAFRRDSSGELPSTKGVL